MEKYLTIDEWCNTNDKNIVFDYASALTLERIIRKNLDLYGFITVYNLTEIIKGLSGNAFDHFLDPLSIHKQKGWKSITDFKFVRKDQSSEPSIHDLWVLVTVRPCYIKEK